MCPGPNSWTQDHIWVDHEMLLVSSLLRDAFLRVFLSSFLSEGSSLSVVRLLSATQVRQSRVTSGFFFLGGGGWGEAEVPLIVSVSCDGNHS